KKPCVVGYRVAVGVVGRLGDDRTDVSAVGGREKHGDGSHGVAHEHEAVLGESHAVQVTHRRTHVGAFVTAEGGEGAVASAVTAQVKEQHGMTSVDERLRVLLIALEGV